MSVSLQTRRRGAGLRWRLEWISMTGMLALALLISHPAIAADNDTHQTALAHIEALTARQADKLADISSQLERINRRLDALDDRVYALNGVLVFALLGIFGLLLWDRRSVVASSVAPLESRIAALEKAWRDP